MDAPLKESGGKIKITSCKPRSEKKEAASKQRDKKRDKEKTRT